jgi:small conductance mechanosensitive channel
LDSQLLNTDILRQPASSIVLWPGAASVAQTENATLSDPVAAQDIEPEAGQSDKKIKSRIENIFAELQPLRGVEVYVGEGVVILRGEVANEMAAQQAKTWPVGSPG